MMILNSKSIIGDFTFDFLTNSQVDNSVDTFTNTASMVIPKNINYKRNGQVVRDLVGGLNPVFMRGIPVKLYSGYDGKLDLQFSGFISDINPTLPLEFKFQDEMYLLKQKVITGYTKKQSDNLTLDKLLADILPGGTKYKALNIQLGKFSIPRNNIVQVLDHLKDHYGISSYFKNGTLYSGLRYINETLDLTTLPVFELERNIIDDSQLIFKRNDDQQIKVRVVSINEEFEGGKRKIVKIQYEGGDPDGDLRTIHTTGVTDMSALKTIANEALNKLKYDGYTGSFTTFLQPSVEAGQAIQLKNAKIPEKQGVFLVKQVVTTWGVDGGRQTIHLDRKIDASLNLDINPKNENVVYIGGTA